MRITVISVGRIREKYLSDAISEYSKRLSRYCKLDQIEVADEKAPETLSEKELEQVLDAEGQRIAARIPDGAFIIALAIDGKQYGSEQLSRRLDQLAVSGESHLVFIIGGSNGLSSAILNRSNEKLSFSNMTFPHQLMKVMLLEQVYRCFRISKNEPYHL